jgi:DNA polymerase-3 subunit epsilon
VPSRRSFGASVFAALDRQQPRNPTALHHPQQKWKHAMSIDDDDFDLLARHASRPGSSSVRTSAEDRAGTILEPGVIAQMVATIEATGDFRVLRRLTLDDVPTSNTEGEETSIAAVVDVETTGTDPERHKIIELALRRFRFDANGVIVKVDRPHAWLQDPGAPLDKEIAALTGLSDADLAGQAIDEAAATKLLKSAAVVIAHHAAFDRRFVERRLPEAGGLAWACSCHEIDWQAAGFQGVGLGWLLAQAGYFFNGAHRAGADVDAVIALLCLKLGRGGTALAELIATASTPGWGVRAVGTHFDVKDRLKSRGYQWHESTRCWRREVKDRDAEEAWLKANVYAPAFRPRCAVPDIRPITWKERFL